MPDSLRYWYELYQRLKYESLCLDIEVTRWNGSVSVVGLYRPKEEIVESTSLIRGVNLSVESLKQALKNCKALITFNGVRFDIPYLKSQFPGAIPNVPIIDLYLIALKLDLGLGLKSLEDRIKKELKESARVRGDVKLSEMETPAQMEQYSNDDEGHEII